MSNLGFSIVGNPKMITIFHFRVTPPPKGVPRGGFGGLEGVYHQESCVMSILRFLIVGNPKMTTIFILGYPQPQQGRPQAPGGGLGGIPPKIVCYVISGVFNIGEYKNDHHFSF